jgi:hypothetical protein
MTSYVHIPFHYCCYTVYHFVSHKRNNSHEKGIKMYNFIIKSIIFKMSIYLYYVMLFTIHVEYILYPHSQSDGYTGIPLYGQTNMKRAITLAKINHPWNWYNMRMLRSWPIKKPNMNKMRQKTNATLQFWSKSDYPSWNYCPFYTPTHRVVGILENRYNMRMLRSWPTRIPNMNKIQRKTND